MKAIIISLIYYVNTQYIVKHTRNVRILFRTVMQYVQACMIGETSLSCERLLDMNAENVSDYSIPWVI